VNPLAITVLIALALSLAANAGLGWAYLGARDATTAAVEQREQWETSAQACGESVEKLQIAAIKRARTDAAATETARQLALQHLKQADRILSTPASTPGNDCKSAQDRATEWLKGRAKP